jgi:multicomponent Na+:H+ antiporter subunit E
MIFFLWNLSLAFFWAAMTGELNLKNLLYGLLIGFVILVISGRALGIERYSHKSRQIILFIGLIFWELLKSSLKIAFDILTPRHRMCPGIVKIPLESKTSLEITMFSNLLSLTPGTLSLDVSDDRKYLYVHIMYIQDSNINNVRKLIKKNFERHVLELLR